MVPRARAALLLRAAGDQGAGLEAGDPLVLLHRRPGRRIGRAGAGRRRGGNRALARRAWLVALAGVAVSPPLLITDLGRPERFLNMLRVFKVTSPMSVGSWVLAGDAAPRPRPRPPASCSGGSRAPAPRRRWRPALLGLPLATYTGGAARQHRGAGLARGAAGAAVRVRRRRRGQRRRGARRSRRRADAGPARRLAVLGARWRRRRCRAMERRLGELASPTARRGGR